MMRYLRWHTLVSQPFLSLEEIGNEIVKDCRKSFYVSLSYEKPQEIKISLESLPPMISLYPAESE